jgi:hypothetical protein
MRIVSSLLGIASVTLCGAAIVLLSLAFFTVTPADAQQPVVESEAARRYALVDAQTTRPQSGTTHWFSTYLDRNTGLEFVVIDSISPANREGSSYATFVLPLPVTATSIPARFPDSDRQGDP